ncbi:MAG: ABC transporter permease [Spirochaetaceae bacterium]|nr:ABC transporter permease [Spirochaetaceae bacterium]
MSQPAEITGVGTGAATRQHRLWELLRRFAREKRIGAISGILVLLFLLVGIFADLLAPYGLRDQELSRRLLPPSAEWPLGTDQFGRDQLSRVIHGARVSMVVGIASSALTIVVAMALGLLCGYWGGAFDLIVQRFVDAWLTFPWLFIVLTVMSILGPGLLQVILVLGISSGIGNTRTVRSVVLSVREAMYVQSARAVGAATFRILWRHIAPELIAPMIVLFTVSLGGNIIAEATLSFLGYGIPPPQPSWGGMLSIEGRQYMLQAPWLAFWPGLCLALVVYGANMFGDALRDLLDPRLRGGAGRFGTTRRAKPLTPTARA